MSRLFTFLLLLTSLAATAQFASPISFETEVEHLSGNEFHLIVKALPEDGWNIYSQYTPDGGPIPTSFTWAEGDHYELIGKSLEKGHKKAGMDEMFGVDVIKFLPDEPTYFIQKVRVINYGEPIRTTIEYMCCDDEQCLPPTDEEFIFEVAPPAPDRGAITPITEPVVAPEAPSTTSPALPAPQTKPVITRPADPQPNERTATAPKVSTPAPPKPAPAAAPTPEEDEQVTEAAFTPGPTLRAAGPAASENDPVSWVFEAEPVAENEYLVRMIGTLSEGWTTYSKDVDPTVGPSPTEFFVDENDGVKLIGDVTETSATLKTKYDKAWDAKVAKIVGGQVVYEQRVDVSKADVVDGYVYYQTCDDEICFPPKEVPFQLDLSGAKAVVSIDGVAGGSGAAAGAGEEGKTAETVGLGIGVAFDADPIGACSVGEEKTVNKGLLSIFGLGFLGGLFALIMPCIFPMIPLTVSFFTKSGGTRAQGIQKAGLYGFFIFLIYVLLSAPFHLIQGLDPGLLNTIASSVPLNVAFFVVFLFFAGSFFGFYELTLPESWSNRASKAEGTGGIAGIFFMALTLALVSFSCTGPILGSLLVESLSGGAWPLTAGMAGFGVALGLPFALFAAFPGFLNSMPKSGGWLNSVKVVLGFVEVALAFKFLSNADLVGEWDFLKIEPFLAIWILCAVGIAAYLFKLISFPLDSKKRKIGIVGSVIGAGSVALAVYLAIGLTTTPETGTYRTRNLLSGIAPPVCYNFFAGCDKDLNLTPFKSLEEGLTYAKEVNKPVMLDFTGFTCVNCRKMEENVWTVDKINRYLTDEYVIVSLYTDDRSELPAEEHVEVDRLDGTGRTKLIDQVGEKWHYFQQTVFARSSQPYYVLVSPDGKTLNAPVAYTPDVDEYENFLKCGLSTYRNLESK
ncbi:hypothetical protein A3850_003700 [Lewinella sp. 4G2]|nr:hypothetical protein A3850_003700 [Lewinella sp. 4G2]